MDRVSVAHRTFKKKKLWKMCARHQMNGSCLVRPVALEIDPLPYL
jgi:hypothetical protein